MFETLFWESPRAICLVTAGGDIRQANKAAFDFFNLNAEDINGAKITSLVDFDFPYLLKFAQTSSGWTTLMQGNRRRGGADTCDLRILRLKRDEGNMIFAVELREVSEERQAFRSLREDVFHTRSLLSQERRLTLRLEAANARLTAFAQRAAHDLSSPLRHIQVALDYYIESLPGDEVPELLGIAQSSSRDLNEMVRKLLEYSRQRRKAVSRQYISLEDIARKAAVRGDGHGDDQDWLALSDLPDVNGDPILLELVFRNLFSNAIRYRHESRPLIVRCRAHDLDGNMRIEVSDNGTGFSPGEADRIFNLFERAHMDAVGHGIGLATCRDLVEAHGWAISAAGTPGEGASFYIEIPAEDVLPDGSAAEREAAKPPRSDGDQGRPTLV